MRRINRCLNKQILNLCQQTIQLDELNLKLAQLLPDTLVEHCRAGSFTKGCLLLVTNKPAIATELRYFLPTLRDTLRTEAGLYQLTSIKIQINAEQYSPNKSSESSTAKPELSSSARDAMRNAGELCSWPPLKEVLFRLANGKKNADM